MLDGGGAGAGAGDNGALAQAGAPEAAGAAEEEEVAAGGAGASLRSCCSTRQLETSKTRRESPRRNMGFHRHEHRPCRRHRASPPGR